MGYAQRDGSFAPTEAGAQFPQRRFQTLLGEQVGVDPGDGLAQCGQRRRGVVLGLVEQVGGGADSVVLRITGRQLVQGEGGLPDLEGGGDEELLGAVVQVPFDASPLDLERVDDPAS